MNTITIEIPDSLSVNSFEVQMLLASRWFEEGKLTSGQAAKMVGLSKRAFIELVGKYGISVFGYEMEDLESDLLNV